MLEELKKIAREAGDAILQYYHDDIEVTNKEDDSPLTKADIAAHNCIVDGLEAMNTGIPIISEEAELPDYQTRKDWNKFWLVDPLDGTKEFIKKNGEFTVNIALISNGEPEIGVVFLPAKNVMYTGSRSEGSFKVENGRIEQIYSEKADKNKPLSVITSRSHKADDLEDQLKEKGIKISKIVQAGSSLKFCFVAEGKADIYPRTGPTMEWDVAAGDAVYRYSSAEAPHKSPLTYNKENLKNEGFLIGF